LSGKRYYIGDTVKLNNKKCIVVRDNSREVVGVSDHSLFVHFMNIENSHFPGDSSIYLLGGNKDCVLKLKSYNFKINEYKHCRMLLVEKNKVII
jgi:uncharacterized protein YlzI (FlbEa/FlbD family)